MENPKDWSLMDIAEKLDVLRHGIGYVMSVVNNMDKNIMKIVQALEEEQNAEATIQEAEKK